MIKLFIKLIKLFIKLIKLFIKLIKLTNYFFNTQKKKRKANWYE